MSHSTNSHTVTDRPWSGAQKTIIDFLWRWLPLLCWMAFIYFLSDQPKLPHPARKLGLSDYVFDYGAHAFTFGVLTVLVWRVLRIERNGWPSWTTRMPIRSAAVWAACYAASDELHQMFVPGRWAKLTDLIADGVGIAAAAGFIVLWERLGAARYLARLTRRIIGKPPQDD